MEARYKGYRTVIIAAIGAIAVLFAASISGPNAYAAVSAEEAATLKTTLTPFGGEKAGNEEGTIPSWNGGYTTPQPDYKGWKRSDPFASDKILFTITAQNMGQYADKLSEGDKALLKKYPEYHINVYQTRRTAAAPQWIYDEVLKNATRAGIVGDRVENCYGGVPFPIAKTGDEALWNVELSWKGGAAWSVNQNTYLINSNEKVTLISDSATLLSSFPYSDPNGSAEAWNGNYQNAIFIFGNPPTRNGEGVILRDFVEHTNNLGYLYFPGQRRVRQVPSSCCDTPSAYSSGMNNNDEIRIWYGYHGRYDWKIVGKKEMYVPYNENRILSKSDKEMITGHVLNPEGRRFELHRVWVVEGNLKPGERHVAPKVVLYLDEDTWLVLEGERYDANGDIWRWSYTLTLLCPDIPCLTGQVLWGGYNLQTGDYFLNEAANEGDYQYKVVPPFGARWFSPSALANRGAR